MEGVLGKGAVRELNDNGFVRTNLFLSPMLLESIHEVFDGMPASASNWSYFQTKSLARYSTGGWRGNRDRFIKSLTAWWSVHRVVRKTYYDKSIFGSSKVLPLVLEDCLNQGLAGFLGDVPLLAGHDIYLENDRHKRTFGYHDDSFGSEIFYQSGDDVTLYVPLVDLTEDSGGRLIVEKHGDQSVRYRDWNRRILHFSDFCRKHGAVDNRGLVTRQTILGSPNRHIIAQEYQRTLKGRKSVPTPGEDFMIPVDAARGEVIIFNNKRYHDIEPWKLDAHRAIYIIRFLPLYDIGMAPPSTFLNNAPCNRYVVDGCRGTLSAVDCDKELPDLAPVPT